MKKTTYITTTLPYVNSDPHIGFALEIIHADIYARYKMMMGQEVFFNTGTDEHGVKIYLKASEAKEDPQVYVDRYAARFKGLKDSLGLWDGINFIRTTDAHHKAAAQEFWKRCEAAGDIYKKNYQIKYCIGCELEKTDSELVDGKCPIHPTYEIELISEENYFFRASKYRDVLLAFYEKQPDFVVPSFRFNEIKAFLERGFEDFSISRLKSKMPWGVPVPGDDTQVMYVWFDALVNYISAIGWPTDMKKFEKWWPVIQFAGKDQVRQQAAMWQSMLMSAGVAPSEKIVIHGFVMSGGQKMSKSIGNVIDPYEIVNEYGKDALRYYVAREIHPFEDSDVTMDKFKTAYNANLANGLGNLVSRTMKMFTANGFVPVRLPENVTVPTEYREALDNFVVNKATDYIWNKVTALDQYIQETAPFKVVKTDPKQAEKILTHVILGLWEIAYLLTPIMPETAAAVQQILKNNAMPEKPLFMRKD